jgi:hypothetical protein
MKNNFISFDERLPSHGSAIIIRDGNDIEFETMIVASDFKKFVTSLFQESKNTLRVSLGYCSVTDKYFLHDVFGKHCSCTPYIDKDGLKENDNRNKYFKHYDLVYTKFPYSWKYVSNKPKLKITLTEYSTTCGDGCCEDFGTVTNVNGVELDCRNTDTVTILEQILEHLGYDVELINEYDYE